MTSKTDGTAFRGKLLLFLHVCISLALLSGACANPHAADKEQAKSGPATVRNATKEADLTTITLTPQAEQRLGIAVAPLTYKQITRTRAFGAEVVLPPDRKTIVSAPIGGTLQDGGSVLKAGMSVRKGQALYRLLPYLAPERDLRLQLEREVAAAETRVEAARLRSERADQLVRDRAGSEKAAQQSREELDLARNDLKTARSRLDGFVSSPLSADTALTIAAPRDGIILMVQVNPGQAVPAGAALFEVADLSVAWIRVPMYVGELGEIAAGQPALVRGLSDPPGRTGRSAKPASAPPSANAGSSTVDLYFEISNEGGGADFLRPGQRVNAVLTLRGTAESLVIPWSAILYDTNGGTWVYENISAQVYSRRRVEVLHVVDSLAVLGRGPAPGAKIVTAGALELFGTEFGAGK